MQHSPSYAAVIDQIVERAPDTRSLFLKLPAGKRLDFRPGEFLSFQLPGEGKTLTRAYTIASDPEDAERLEICLNLVPDGPGSHYLFSRHIGDCLTFTGPWGNFVLDQAPQAECIFIADGAGIAAIRPMLKRALSGAPQFPLHLVYATQRESGLIYREQLEEWAQGRSHFDFIPVLEEASSEWSGLRGNLFEYVEARYVNRDKNRARHFYICGVGQLVVQLRDLLRKAGYERRAVKYEKW